ncbi:lipase family protein [Devosia nitrariae]|uniref:Lipase (Class 3) n=1 Tax=Devosia nitrariae TaxID=2071872 RepID=A0ABQ5W1R8_9HYPH|nr:hypothetical protein [Devosia nitrariae]GLQ53809.1 hypothetical protein GCM10010862_10680 [Devosia nitrariae]
MPDDQEVLAQHEVAALASAAVYAHPASDEPLSDLPDFALDRVLTDDHCGTGFHAAGFVRDEVLVLAFRGSDEPLDLASGANLATCQYEPNRVRLLAYARDKRWRSVIITGHSLGGGLAQYLAYDLARDWPASRGQLMLVTFNGLGGVYGLTQMYGSIDPAIVGRLKITAYAHPDDVIARVGQQLGGITRLLVCERTPLPSLQACHGIRQFLSVDGVCALAQAYDHADRPYAIMRSATIIGDDLRAAVIAAHERLILQAVGKVLRVWLRIPVEERLEVLRFILSLTPVRRIVRRGAQFWFTCRTRLTALRRPPSQRPTPGAQAGARPSLSADRAKGEKGVT